MAVNDGKHTFDKVEIEILQTLEESLWRSETRFNWEYLERILAPDFFEFGGSGRVYSRAEIIAAPSAEIHCELPLQDFSVHTLSPEVVLVTYISKVYGQRWEFANRSSIWIKSEAGWQLTFHQGTPFPQ